MAQPFPWIHRVTVETHLGRLRPEAPLDLAVVRVVVAATLLASPELRDAPRLAGLPTMRVAPEGLRWFVRFVPIGTHLAYIALVLAGSLASGALAVLGCRSRCAMAVLAVSAFYAFAISQLGGVVLHDMHSARFAALLAVSPCGDALGWDARARSGNWLGAHLEPSSAYAWPLLGVRMLLGAIYFFPGLWKLRASGLAWIFSDNLRNQLYTKWYENDWLPALRVDRAPALLHVAALLVVAFELSFWALALFRCTRWAAACAGLAFHAAAGALMLMPFVGLWCGYAALVPWARIARRFGASGGGASDPTKPAGAPHDEARTPAMWPCALVGAALVVGAIVQGVRGTTQAWPFGCYPTFQWIAGELVADLQVLAVTSDGLRQVPIARDEHGKRSQVEWAILWSVAGAGRPFDRARLRAYFDVQRTAPGVADAIRDARVIRFFRAYRSVVPEHWADPPVRRTFLDEVALTP